MRFHMNLPARDLEATTRFYTALFGQGPVKTKSDYVKFLPGRPDLNLSFHEAASIPEGARDVHVGIEFEDVASLDAAHARLKAADLLEDDRETSICCYANQDKFHVIDPDGHRWELYVLLEHTELKIETNTGCCAPTGESTGQAPCC